MEQLSFNCHFYFSDIDVRNRLSEFFIVISHLPDVIGDLVIVIVVVVEMSSRSIVVDEGGRRETRWFGMSFIWTEMGTVNAFVLIRFFNVLLERERERETFKSNEKYKT